MTVPDLRSRPIFTSVVHIEGMDLAGKSTVTAKLAQQHGGIPVHHNALTDHNPIYELADGLRRQSATTADILGHLYVAAIRLDLTEVDSRDQPAIQDSTLLLRSLAYNQVIGATDIVHHLFRLIDRHPRFGVSVVLTASLDARLDRLKQRQRDAPHEIADDDLLIHSNPRRFLAMEEALIDHATAHFQATIIDTSDLAPSKVVQNVEAIAASVLTA